MIAGGAASGHAQGFFHDGAHATLVDVAHGEDLDSGFADVFLLVRIDVADADQNAIFRVNLWREVEDVAEFIGPKTHDGGQGHAVHVAAGRGIGRVHVAVGVDPDEANLLVLLAIELGDAGYRARRYR